MKSYVRLPLVLWLLVVSFASCTDTLPNASENTEGNKTTILSTDIARLAKLIDLKNFTPDSVHFRYTFIDNSGSASRLTVPGPSDSFLEALLYFDSTTFARIVQRYLLSSTVQHTTTTTEKFHFKWLSAAVEKEWRRTDSLNLHGQSDLLFGLGMNGRLLFLHNKILLINVSH